MGSFAVRKYADGAWEGNEVQASPVAPEAAAGLGEGRTTAPGGETVARLGRTRKRSTASAPVQRPRWDRGRRSCSPTHPTPCPLTPRHPGVHASLTRLLFLPVKPLYWLVVPDRGGTESSIFPRRRVRRSGRRERESGRRRVGEERAGPLS